MFEDNGQQVLSITLLDIEGPLDIEKMNSFIADHPMRDNYELDAGTHMLKVRFDSVPQPAEIVQAATYLKPLVKMIEEI